MTEEKNEQACCDSTTDCCSPAPKKGGARWIPIIIIVAAVAVAAYSLVGKNCETEESSCGADQKTSCCPSQQGANTNAVDAAPAAE